jgi:hypothetical protein
MKLKLVKIVVDLKNLSKNAKLIDGIKAQGGMLFWRVSIGGGSSLIIGTYEDKDSICFMSAHLLYVDLL